MARTFDRLALVLMLAGCESSGQPGAESSGASENSSSGATGGTDAQATSTGEVPTGGAEASTSAADSSTGADETSSTSGTSMAPTTGDTTSEPMDTSTGAPLDPCAGPRPGPDNTGVPAGVTLTPSGSITIEEDGAVVEGLDIEGMITVLADNVTIRNVRLRSGDYYPIRYFDEDNVGLVVEDSEIEGYGGDATAAISFSNYTARRLNIHGSADGLKADSNVLVEDCWIHDLSNGPDEHNDGVQSTGGAGVTLRHNDISGASNAAVQTGDEGGATIDLNLECNWFAGGGWTLNIRGEGETVPMNTRIVDNRFARDHGYGPWTLDDPSPTISGNVYDDNDEPIE